MIQEHTDIHEFYRTILDAKRCSIPRLQMSARNKNLNSILTAITWPEGCVHRLNLEAEYEPAYKNSPFAMMQAHTFADQEKKKIKLTSEMYGFILCKDSGEWTEKDVQSSADLL